MGLPQKTLWFDVPTLFMRPTTRRNVCKTGTAHSYPHLIYFPFPLEINHLFPFLFPFSFSLFLFSSTHCSTEKREMTHLGSPHDAYDFIEQIGDGSFGTVHKAQNKISHKVVSSKKAKMRGSLSAN